MVTIGHGKKLAVPAGRHPRVLRVGVLVLELALVVLIAYQLAGLFFRFVEPETKPIAAGPVPLRAESRRVEADTSKLLGFDPFFRKITGAPTVVAATAAPESSLKLELFGLRATGSGQGSAIVKAQDGQQRLVRVGDAVAPGVTLAGVYPDRLEITRAGALEAIYLRPQGERTPQVSEPEQTVAAPRTGRLDFLSAIPLEAVRRDRRIIGFRLPADIPDMVAAFGLEAGDILLEANGEPLNSYERIEEIGEELANARRIDLTLERRGETRSLSLGL